MKDVSRRVVGYWEEEIVPVVRSGKRVLVAVRLSHSIQKIYVPTGLAVFGPTSNSDV